MSRLFTVPAISMPRCSVALKVGETLAMQPPCPCNRSVIDRNVSHAVPQVCDLAAVNTKRHKPQSTARVVVLLLHVVIGEQ